MDITELQLVAGHLKINTDGCSTLIELLFVMIKAVLAVSDKQVMEIIALRLTLEPTTDIDCMEAILQVDEAAAALEHDEEQQLRATVRASQAQQHGLRDFHAEFRSKMQSISADAVGGGPAKRAKKTRVVIPEVFTALLQKDLKKLVPPDTLIWLSRSSESWKCRVKGWPSEISRSWRTRAESDAVRLVLSEAWYQHGVLTGIDWGDLPVDGLLADFLQEA